MTKETGGKKVLVVDDSEIILKSVKNVFEELNFEVFTSHDGLEGLQKAAELKPDLIFLDLMMPQLDGIKMLQVKKVLKDIAGIPVIVISANTARSNVMAAMEAGADRVISKPLNKEKLINEVNDLLKIKLEASSANKIFNESDNNNIKNELVKYFVSSFPAKRQAIATAIKDQNHIQLKSLMHELKGAGGTMGYQSLTDLSAEIETKEIKSQMDWVFVEMKCSKLFQQVKLIEEEIN